MEDKTKSITFDKEAQDNLPQHIKDKMKADRAKAEKEMPEDIFNQIAGKIKPRAEDEPRLETYIDED